MELLVLGRKVGVERLVQAGFVNEVLDCGSGKIVDEVVKRLRESLEGKDPEACLLSKQLVKDAMPDPDTA